MELAFEHLLGRQYVPGKVHCLTLVRDFYRENFGIDIPDYAVPHDWDANKLDLIEKVHGRLGFEKVENWSIKTLRPADLLCIAVRSSNANHFLINLPDNQVLHHPLMQLSRVDPMRSFYRMSTCYVLRHPSVPDLTPVKPDVTIQELLDARYRLEATA